MRRILILFACCIFTAVAQGQRVTPVERGVIVGRVLDPTGQPVVGADVEATRRFKTWNGPFEEVRSNSRDVSDDRGMFRLHSLEAGEYVVAVQPPRDTTPNPPSGFVRTYYPSTSMLSAAGVVRVVSGRERNADVTFIRTPYTTVSGRAVTSLGAPAAFIDVLVLDWSADVSARLAAFGPRPVVTWRTDKDGTFMVPRVPPGRYLLRVMQRPAQQPVRTFELAEVPIDTTAGPLSGVQMATTPAARVRGRLVWAGEGPTPWPGLGALGRLRAALIEPGGDLGTGDADIAPDGSFEFAALYGIRHIYSWGLLSNWAIQSVQAPDHVAYRPRLRFTPGTSVDDVRVVVTDRVGVLDVFLNGVTVDSTSKTGPNVTVMLMPDSPTELTMPNPGFDHLQRDYRGRSGRVFHRIERIVPRRYLAAAIDIPAYLLQQDSDLMNRVRVAATPVDIKEGYNELELNVIPLGDYKPPSAGKLR